MIENSKRLEHISEYYFSKKLREVKSLIDKGEDIINLGIGSPDLFPPENSINTVIKSLNQKMLISIKAILVFTNYAKKFLLFIKIL